MEVGKVCVVLGGVRRLSIRFNRRKGGKPGVTKGISTENVSRALN